MHAYVLMPNHVHILATSETEGGISRLMKDATQRYTQWINRTTKRIGTLWEGRYRSSLVDTGQYFLNCHRYIELNPVRAGIVNSPEQCTWSSHAANAHARPSLVVEPHPVYLQLGASTEERCRVYRTLFKTSLSLEELQRIRGALNAGYPFGSAEFLATMEAHFGRRVTPGKPGRPKRYPENTQPPPGVAENVV